MQQTVQRIEYPTKEFTLSCQQEEMMEGFRCQRTHQNNHVENLKQWHKREISGFRTSSGSGVTPQCLGGCSGLELRTTTRHLVQ